MDAAYRVQTSLGPGLLESDYEAVLAFELEHRGLRVVRQQAVPIIYPGTRTEVGFRADLIVADKRLGLLLSFNVALQQRWHHPHRQWDAGLISRKAAKPAKKTPMLCENSNIPRRSEAEPR